MRKRLLLAESSAPPPPPGAKARRRVFVVWEHAEPGYLLPARTDDDFAPPEPRP